ncbi:hypothetical protein AQZ52_02875 [Novosphingobium fuchskuhlense]|uniref:Uncharacterized protein n=1 Tax=Novosphingobium fuchskuhlense TaxID=1117702 RepID=A0A124JVF8_9SPHN|nr:hypothetical protein [Novosphingobium fuchskuhlense]KUR72243.1 hypothetical protein AQZ52_02875 [Novosphingobium fuchskuhlense]
MASRSFQLGDAEWLAHRLVEGTDAVRFAHVPRAAHEGMAFLTDESFAAHFGAMPDQVDVPAVELLAGMPRRPLGLLLHSAFCGSTLLTRALAAPGVAMGLSEPVILNDVVGMRTRGAAPAAVARAADLALRLLARPFAQGEGVVIKPSNLLNPFAELLLALAPEARALFLYAPLKTFLVSVVRKGLPCRLWVRELLEGYLKAGIVAPLGITPEDVFRQTDLQVAATGWLAQHRLFALLAAKVGPERLRTLTSEQLTSDPARAIAASAGHYGLALEPSTVARIAAGPAFTRHSKSGEAFTPTQRRAEYAAAHAAHAEEINLVHRWALDVAEQAGIAMDAPNPLLQPA